MGSAQSAPPGSGATLPKAAKREAESNTATGILRRVAPQRSATLRPGNSEQTPFHGADETVDPEKPVCPVQIRRTIRGVPEAGVCGHELSEGWG